MWHGTLFNAWYVLRLGQTLSNADSFSKMPRFSIQGFYSQLGYLVGHIPTYATYPTWEGETMDFVVNNAAPDSCYLDFGMWIGPTILQAQDRYKALGMNLMPLLFGSCTLTSCSTLATSLFIISSSTWMALQRRCAVLVSVAATLLGYTTRNIPSTAS
mmetsp:Transcript_4653/g.8405  ORF Transcript_4653/g.8405 Transcript_4653/m.8405 type:complete len:158 (-) Transcript_4653:425-898(-)